MVTGIPAWRYIDLMKYQDRPRLIQLHVRKSALQKPLTLILERILPFTNSELLPKGPEEELTGTPFVFYFRAISLASELYFGPGSGRSILRAPSPYSQTTRRCEHALHSKRPAMPQAVIQRKSISLKTKEL
jgi:hypothetical protein